MLRGLLCFSHRLLPFTQKKCQTAAFVFRQFAVAAPETVATQFAPTIDNCEKQYAPRVVKIVEEIASLNLLEVSDLNELLVKRLNIKAPAHNIAFMPAQAVAPTNEETDEDDQAPAKSAYAVKLMKFDATRKVALIKEIKNILPDMNLVQAKKLVEAAPGVLKKDLSKDEAETVKKALEACGASVELE